MPPMHVPGSLNTRSWMLDVSITLIFFFQVPTGNLLGAHPENIKYVKWHKVKREREGAQLTLWDIRCESPWGLPLFSNFA